MNQILVVDDDENILLGISEVLESSEYKITTKRSVESAISELKNLEYHILITEIRMPEEKDGLDFIHQVFEKYPQILIIVVSGNSDLNFVIKILLEKKIYDYLLKPYKPEMLQVAVERARETYNLRKKKESFVSQEEAVFKNVIQIFDWKKEINNKYLESIAPDLIRQINIGMLQGSGIGSLASALSIFFTKSEYKPELKGFLIPEKVFDLIQKNYKIVSTLLASLSEAQAIMLESENYTEKLQVSDILPLFNEAIEELQTMLQIKNQKIKLTGMPSNQNNKEFIYKKDKMKLVLQELLVNAMKYSRKNDSIFVLFFIHEDSFDIKILNKAYKSADGSLGVTGKNESRVFEPFYRLQNVVDDNYNMERFKFGLGLTIVKKIMQLHGGDISIYNVNNNLGAFEKDVCVWLRFPFIKK